MTRLSYFQAHKKHLLLSLVDSNVISSKIKLIIERMDAKKLQSGFVIYELIIAIAVSFIIAFLFLAKIEPITGVSPAKEAVKVLSDLRYAQFLSINKNQRYRFVKLAADEYGIVDSAGVPVVNPATGQTITHLTPGIIFGTLVNLPNNMVVFSGDGTPYMDAATPGTKLASDANIPLTDFGVSTATIVITPDTGRMTIQ